MYFELEYGHIFARLLIYIICLILTFNQLKEAMNIILFVLCSLHTIHTFKGQNN